MKKTGWLHVEQVEVRSCHFEQGTKDKTDNMPVTYRRLWFEYENGQKTKEYTVISAPAWLLELYHQDWPVED